MLVSLPMNSTLADCDRSRIAVLSICTPTPLFWIVLRSMRMGLPIERTPYVTAADCRQVFDGHRRRGDGARALDEHAGLRRGDVRVADTLEAVATVAQAPADSGAGDLAIGDPDIHRISRPHAGGPARDGHTHQPHAGRDRVDGGSTAGELRVGDGQRDTALGFPQAVEATTERHLIDQVCGRR